MHDRVELRIAGEVVVLLADRALFWPARNRLLIADLHLGKADTFRRAGIGLPRGGTTQDLERLSLLIDETGAAALWVLGDMLHGPVHDTAWRQAWRDWRSRRPWLEVAVLAGNHDRVLADASLDIRLLGERCDEVPFALRHHPEPVPNLHTLCGHLHPRLVLPGWPGKRWPVFWLRENVTVLPAFSAFTGGVLVNPSVGEAVAVCAQKGIVLVRSSPG